MSRSGIWRGGSLNLPAQLGGGAKPVGAAMRSAADQSEKGNLDGNTWVTTYTASPPSVHRATAVPITYHHGHAAPESGPSYLGWSAWRGQGNAVGTTSRPLSAAFLDKFGRPAPP